MYQLPTIEDYAKLSCKLYSLDEGKSTDLTFKTYDVDISLNKSEESFTPFGFKAMASETILNILQLESHKEVAFLSTAWKEAYYILTLKEIEAWAQTMDVSMLIIQTTDKVALEALLEQNFNDFSIINTSLEFSISGRKWYRKRNH